VVLHPLECNQAIAGRLYDLVEHLEAIGLIQLKRLELVLNQPLGRFLERLLHLTDAHRAHAPVSQTVLNQHLAEEVRLPRAAPTVYALVAGRDKQGLEYPRRLNP
jgi:hypothetical protein